MVREKGSWIEKLWCPLASVLVVDKAVAAWTAGWPLTNSSTVLPGVVVPMNTGWRSEVTLSPTMPVSLAGLRRKSVTGPGIALVTIWKATWLLSVEPTPGYCVYCATT